MKWANLFLLGYAILLAGIVAALWKAGVLEHVGAGWTAIGVVMVAGIGIMDSVARSRRRESTQIEG